MFILLVNLHLRASSLGFSHSLLRSTPTAWGFSLGSFSLRPFSQQFIILTHHLRVFPTLSPPLHAHRVGFLPGKLFSTPIPPVNLHPLASSPGFSHSLLRSTPTAWVFSPGSFSLRPFPRQKFPPSLAISQGTLYTTYMNHTISKHTMIWIYIVLSVSGNIHMFGT